jgi:hypothetical protein
MIRAKEAEPPSWLRPPLFMIGQDHRGNWVVKDQNGLCGGLFIDRDAAVRFVRAENGYRPQAVVMVSDVLELNTSRNHRAPPHREIAADFRDQRRIA